MSFPATHTSFRNIVGFLVAALMVIGLTGCFGTESPSGPEKNGSEKDVALKIRMGVGSVTALGKSSVITLNKLVVVITSSTNDTIRDTITSVTSPALNPVSTTGQTVTKNYTLKALRSWKIIATSRDSKDSVVHRDSSTIPAMYAGDTAVVNLNLSSKFSMYEAKFLTLPDSIQNVVPSQPKQILQIDRLVLKIDGVIVKDSVVTPAFFAHSTTHTLAYDYVRTGSRTIQMIAYGPMGDWPADSALFRGTTTISAGAGVDSTIGITLGWVGPTTGTGNIEVTLGRVGTVTVNGTLPGTISIP
jgi:hypothetical protein